MIKRLRIKFVCINMAIVTTMLLVIFGLVFFFTGENMQRQSLRSMAMAGELPPPRTNPVEAPDKVRIPLFVVEITRDNVKIDSPNGYFVYPEETVLRELLPLAENSGQISSNLRNYALRFHKINTPEGKRIVFADISSEMEMLSGLLKTCTVIGVLSFAAFLAISILLANWAIRPVEQAWDQQRQFVADASHELKTPLAVIMTSAELLQTAKPEQREQFARNILLVSEQMRSLVERLLELARVDNGTAKMEFAVFDFSEAVCDSLLLFEPVYFEKGLVLESDVEAGIRVRGSRSHLQQVVEILLENGVKYARGAAPVVLRLRRRGSQCLLSVATPGEEISPEDLKNIFKRFYRIDSARSRDGSYGLGLSIADSILQQHGGKIWAESSGGINTFYVQVSQAG